MASTCVLLVDDDRLVLATVGQGLRQAGYDVVEAASGEEALRHTEARRPDLAILDMRMPGMSGTETARALHRDTDVPVIFLSAYNDSATVTEAATEGAFAYLVKPLDVGQIVPTVETTLKRATDLRQWREQENRLTLALSGNRDIATAVGLVMERYRLDRRAAFEALRFHARSQRRKLEEVARDLVEAQELLTFPAEILDRVMQLKSEPGPKSS